MSLVLAIEPDAVQAAQLAPIVQQLGADLAVVTTTGDALKALGGRIPDLVLVPALLSPREEATLADALRTVAGDAPVRLLIKPLLSSGQSKDSGGLMANLRRRKKKPSAVADGCDPATFGEQMAVYLGEPAGKAPPPSPALAEQPEPAPPVKPAPIPAPVAEPVHVTEPVHVAEPVYVAEPVHVAETLPVVERRPLPESSLVLEPLLVVDTPPPAGPLPAAPAEPSPPVEPLVWPSLESLLVQAAEPPPVPKAPIEAPPVVLPPAAATGPHEGEWRDLVASLHRAADALQIEKWLTIEHESKSSEPVCDEWGFHDPAQFGVSALLNKIDRMDGTDNRAR